jgi:hypothetical protein
VEKSPAFGSRGFRAGHDILIPIVGRHVAGYQPRASVVPCLAHRNAAVEGSKVLPSAARSRDRRSDCHSCAPPRGNAILRPRARARASIRAASARTRRLRSRQRARLGRDYRQPYLARRNSYRAGKNRTLSIIACATYRARHMHIARDVLGANSWSSPRPRAGSLEGEGFPGRALFNVSDRVRSYSDYKVNKNEIKLNDLLNHSLENH